MNSSNKIVHGLWIGPLTPMVQLTLQSFINNGHTFNLWRYEPINHPIPKEVVIQNANKIIPQTQIFRKKENDPKFKLGKNSLGTFSDIFRYKLLYEYGGWWTDMDITCLKPLDFETPYYFRKHTILPLIGNLMKCPPKSEIMKLAYQKTQSECNENTKDWLLTNKILNQIVLSLNLSQYIRNQHANPDSFHRIEKYIYTSTPLPSNWHFVHWMNEEWHKQNLLSTQFVENSTLAQLMKIHHIKISTTSPSLFFLFKWHTFQHFLKLKTIIKAVISN